MEFDFDTSNVTLLVELDRGFLFAMDYDYKNKFMYFPRYLDEDIVRYVNLYCDDVIKRKMVKSRIGKTIIIRHFL